MRTRTSCCSTTRTRVSQVSSIHLYRTRLTATLETSSPVDELPDPLVVRDVPELPRRIPIPMAEAIPEPTAPLSRGPTASR